MNIGQQVEVSPHAVWTPTGHVLDCPKKIAIPALLARIFYLLIYWWEGTTL